MSSTKRGSIIYFEKPLLGKSRVCPVATRNKVTIGLVNNYRKGETIAIELKKIAQYCHNQKVKTRQAAHVRGERMAFESKWWTLLFAKLVVTNFTLGIGVAVKLLFDP